VKAISRLCFTWLVAIPLMSVLSLEVVLQVGARLAHTGRSDVTGWKTGNLRVVCLGDSHTYGLYLAAEESYPARLEELWNASVAAPKIEVINLGYPGTNSSRILKNLPDVIATFKPDIVTVLVGINDFWTQPVDTSDQRDGWLRSLIWLRDSSRVYKIVYMLQRQRVNREAIQIDQSFRHNPYDPAFNRQYTDAVAKAQKEVDAAVRYGDRAFSLGAVYDAGKKDKPMQALRENLLAMNRIADAKGVRLLLISYAVNGPMFEWVNKEYRSVSQTASGEVLDLTTLMQTRCPDDPVCARYFFSDWHPTAAGSAEIASRLQRAITSSP